MSDKSSLPTVVSQVAPDLRRWINRVREILGGSGPDSVLRESDLPEAVAGLPPILGNYLTPPAPVSVTATGSMTAIIVEWSGIAYPGHAYTQVWRANTDDLGAAVMIGTSRGELYPDAVGSDASHFYWVRFINQDNEGGPYNATAGTAGETAEDLLYIMDMLSEAYGGESEAPFFQLDEPLEINGVEIPAGTYIKTAKIHDAQIVTAMIKNLAVTTAKIVDLAVSTAKIENAAISGAKIAALAVQTGHIDLLAVTNALIADATIQSAKIVSLNADKIVAATLSAITADVGTLTAGVLRSADSKMVIDLTNKYIYIE